MTIKIKVTVDQLFANGSYSIFREGELSPANCLELLSFMVFHHKSTPMTIFSFTKKEFRIKYHRMTLWSDHLLKVAALSNESIANLYRFQPLGDRDVFGDFDELVMTVVAYITLFPAIATPDVRKYVASLAASKSFP